jgi:lipopolysaccharide export system protein LptA
LSGNAKVVIDDVPKTPTSQSGELHGDKITMNMKTGEVNVTEGAHFEGDLPSKEAKE